MTLRDNLWTEAAGQLGRAYVAQAGVLRFDIATRVLVAVLGDSPARVLDLGGGFGEQAVRLARHGHQVTVVDIDERMLELAAQRVSRESPDVAPFVSFVLGDAASLEDVGIPHGAFDLVCCHSVLAYERDALPVVRAMVEAAAGGGILSIITSNDMARAMRSGLEGRWPQAAQAILDGRETNPRVLPTAEHRRVDIEGLLGDCGASIIGWHGLGVFTDHGDRAIGADKYPAALLCEWLGGVTDPYRLVARAVHMLAQSDLPSRVSNDDQSEPSEQESESIPGEQE